MSPYFTYLAILTLINILMVASLNLATGWTGLVHLGHIAIAGVGAYAAAILMVTGGAPFAVALIGGGIAGALIGFIIAIPTREIRRDSFALATLAVGWALIITLFNWDTLTGGALGIVGVPRPIFARGNDQFLLLTLGIVMLSLAVMWQITASPFGRLLGAIRDDEVAARTLGKHTVAAKRACLAIAGFFTGIGGALLASFIQFVHPTMFFLPVLIPTLAGVIVGGLASHAGSVVGTALLALFAESLRYIPMPPELVGPLRMILYGALILIVIMFRPKGILGKVEFE